MVRKRKFRFGDAGDDEASAAAAAAEQSLDGSARQREAKAAALRTARGEDAQDEDVDDAAAQIAALRALESGIMQSMENVNDVVKILTVCTSDDTPRTVRIATFHILHRVFTHLARVTAPAAGKKKAKKARVEGETPSSSSSALVAQWVRSKRTRFETLVLETLGRARHVSLQCSCLHIAMEWVAGGDHFDNALFGDVCRALVHTKYMNDALLEYVAKHYLKFHDTQFYMLRSLATIAAELKATPPKGDRPVRNVFSLLILAQVPPHDSDITSWLVAPQVAVRADGAPVATKLTKARTHHKTHGECWVAFLKLALPLDLYKRVLVRLDTRILPFTTEPLLLSDFLTDSFNVGGVVSVLALSGLFTLITRYNLEYPHYYKKLYSLFTPNVYHVKYRARFFRLVALSLTSSFLPEYLVAAFCKRLARLSLTAPAAGCLFNMALIYNLLRQHPQCLPLIHNPKAAREAREAREAEEEGEGEGASGSLRGLDPFVAGEDDPAECCAGESSLWELVALENHYAPGVAQFAKVFRLPMEREAYDLDAFIDLSYHALLDQEARIRRRKKQSVGVAVEDTPPKLGGLLADSVVGDLWAA